MLQNEEELINNFNCFKKCKYCNFIVQGIYHNSCKEKDEEFINK